MFLIFLDISPRPQANNIDGMAENDDDFDESGQSDTLWAHFRPPWRKIPGEVDVSFK